MSSARARSNASSPQAYQSTGLFACWRRYGLVSCARRFTEPTLPARFAGMPGYADLEVGAVYRSRFGRTVLEADNVWFTLLTLNTNPIHFDAEYAASTEWGRPLVDSTFTLALVTGMSVVDVSERAVNLGWREVTSAGARLRGRHDPRRDGDPGQARVGVASGLRHRHRADARAQPARRGRDRLRADGHGAACCGLSGCSSGRFTTTTSMPSSRWRATGRSCRGSARRRVDASSRRSSSSDGAGGGTQTGSDRLRCSSTGSWWAERGSSSGIGGRGRRRRTPLPASTPSRSSAGRWRAVTGASGYATEAARAVRDWAHRERGIGRLISLIDPKNVRSVRVAVKLGCEPEELVRLWEGTRATRVGAPALGTFRALVRRNRKPVTVTGYDFVTTWSRLRHGQGPAR